MPIFLLPAGLDCKPELKQHALFLAASGKSSQYLTAGFIISQDLIRNLSAGAGSMSSQAINATDVVSKTYKSIEFVLIPTVLAVILSTLGPYLVSIDLRNHSSAVAWLIRKPW